MYSLARNESLSTGKETSFELYLESRLAATQPLLHEFYFLQKYDPFSALSIAANKVKNKFRFSILKRTFIFGRCFFKHRVKKYSIPKFLPEFRFAFFRLLSIPIQMRPPLLSGRCCKSTFDRSLLTLQTSSSCCASSPKKQHGLQLHAKIKAVDGSALFSRKKDRAATGC